MSEFDTAVLEWLYSLRDPVLVQLFMVITELGRAWVIYALALSIALILIFHRHYARAVGLVISVSSAGILIVLLKGLIERARPPLELQAYVESWYSFPSAHAALSVALYGFLVYLAWQLMPSSIGRYIALLTAFVIIFLISFSRIYLGVHYPSDVLSGILVGLVSVWLGSKYAKIAHNGNS